MKKQSKSKSKIVKLTDQADWDSHVGFSKEECQVVLRYFNLPDVFFFNWMDGQTCPMLPNGKIGVYWYDLNRYIRWKVVGEKPIFD